MGPESISGDGPEALPAHRWHYREVRIPLNLSTRDLPSEVMVIRRYEQIVARHLDRWTAAGWEPDGPTDWHRMLLLNRIQVHGATLATNLWSAGQTHLYESVTIRVRRSEPGS
jgi:hypothetical protein